MEFGTLVVSLLGLSCLFVDRFFPANRRHEHVANLALFIAGVFAVFYAGSHRRPLSVLDQLRAQREAAASVQLDYERKRSAELSN